MSQILINQLADAFEAVARVDHYMVGIVYEYDSDQLDAAEQVLITRQNCCAPLGERHAIFERALDLLESLRAERMRARTVRSDTTLQTKVGK